MRLFATVAAVLLLSIRLATAAPGDLDPTFGGDGVVVNPLVGTSDEARAIAVQPDGKIVVAGYVTTPNGREFALWRHDPDGTLDEDFGTGGVAQASFGPDDDEAYEILVQSDGKLVAAGYADLGSDGAVAVVRFEADGDPDPDFGFSGKVTTVPLGESGVGEAALLQPDGKIVVAGHSAGQGLVVRYDDTGALDASFGMGGIVLLDAGPGSEQLYSIVLQPDGMIVVAGAATTGPLFLVARLEADGTPDATFGSGGIVTTSFGAVSFGSYANGIALQPDGALVAAGRGRDGSPHFTDHGIARYDGAGALDPTFGTGGRVHLDYGEVGDEASSLVLQPDGRIVVAGLAYDDDDEDLDLALARLRSDGTLDGTFGGGGLLRTDLAGGTDAISGVTLQSDGKIVVVGRTESGGPRQVVVARYGAVALGCAAAPLVGCRTATLPLKGRLKLKDKLEKDAGDQLSWQWKSGAATDFAALGDPLASDDYVLCLYDESGPPALHLEYLMAAGGTCGSKPCWVMKPAKSIDYRDKLHTPSGVATLSLRPGQDGKARIRLVGKGEHLPPAGLPLPLPLRVQLQAEHGECWEATYSAAGVVVNDAIQFIGGSN